MYIFGQKSKCLVISDSQYSFFLNCHTVHIFKCRRYFNMSRCLYVYNVHTSPSQKFSGPEVFRYFPQACRA